MSKQESGRLGAIASKDINQERYMQLRKKYELEPIICISCQISISYEKRHGKKKFCSRSCSAKYTNVLRSKESRKKQAQSLKNTRRPTRISPEYVGEYTKVYRNICKKSGVAFFYKSIRKFHPTVQLEKDQYYNQCRFRFGIRSYPGWFDEKLLKYGFYSNRGKLNPNGISRDHMFSVKQGWLLGISPWVISHPANCQLMIHSQNVTKGINCSITLEELNQRIERFNAKFGAPKRN